MAASFTTTQTFWTETQIPEGHPVAELLTAAGLTPALDADLSNLSLGQRRAAAVAGVLLVPKRWVLLDEPFAGLSPPVGNRLIAALMEEATRRLVIYAEHDIGYARRADLIAIMAGGRVVRQARPADIEQEELLGYFVARD
jgi:energy-coupling factor transporter ATP-binding protein EcfA2